MTRSLSHNMIVGLVILLGSSHVSADTPKDEPVEAGTVPTDAQGRQLNLDFETGTLADWTAEGDAFRGQPIEGDTVHRRRGDMHSRHAGRFWIGTYDIGGDTAEGDLDLGPLPGDQAVRQLPRRRGVARKDLRGAGPERHGKDRLSCVGG